jgi:MFS family permease
VLELPAWAAVAVIGISGLANGLINPSLHAIITLRIPAELRPTVMSSLMTLHALSMPIGILSAGPLLDAFGVEPLFAACAAIQTLVMLLAALAAVRARRALPLGHIVARADRGSGPQASRDRPSDEDVRVAAPARSRARAPEEPRPHAPPSGRRGPPRDARARRDAQHPVEVPAGQRVEPVDLELDSAGGRR